MKQNQLSCAVQLLPRQHHSMAGSGPALPLEVEWRDFNVPRAGWRHLQVPFRVQGCLRTTASLKKKKYYRVFEAQIYNFIRMSRGRKNTNVTCSFLSGEEKNLVGR